MVRLVGDLTPDDQTCSMRACILIAQIAAMRLRTATLSDALLAQISADVLSGRGIAVTTGQIAKYLDQRPQEEKSI
jgi:hypothetical protein